MGITDIGYIKEAAGLLRENGLAKIEIRDSGACVILERAGAAAPVYTVPAPGGGEPKPAPARDIIDFNNAAEIKSPLVGVFYSAPTPEAEPFVRIGDEVRRGDVLCIIEAMKLMNEITAEQDGKIVDICLKNGDIAEFGQVLFILSE